MGGCVANERTARKRRRSTPAAEMTPSTSPGASTPYEHQSISAKRHVPGSTSVSGVLDLALLRYLRRKKGRCALAGSCMSARNCDRASWWWGWCSRLRAQRNSASRTQHSSVDISGICGGSKGGIEERREGKKRVGPSKDEKGGEKNRTQKTAAETVGFLSLPSKSSLGIALWGEVSLQCVLFVYA